MGLEDGLKSGFKDLINYSISIELRYTENTCKILNIQILDDLSEFRAHRIMDFLVDAIVIKLIQIIADAN